MVPSTPKTRFDGRIVMLGFGSVGQAVLPLLLRHLDMPPGRIEVIQPSARGLEVAHRLGARHTQARLERGNVQAVLAPRLQPGDVLLNLSVQVSSCALMALCQQRQWLYLDTCTEPWPGTYDDGRVPAGQRSNYRLREQALALREAGRAQTTALMTLGANPGLVSLLVKQALLDLAGPGEPVPPQREGWARLARRLGVRAIHIAERDTQSSPARKQPDEFVNTWSVDGFIAEGLQPAELGWGTHERHFPPDGLRHAEGCRAAICLNRPGAATRVRTWTPLAGPIHGFLITHAESISIADHLTLGPAHRPDYRPTVHYAYHPCDDAVLSLHELAGRQWRPQEHRRLLRDDITHGCDELGVLLMGHDRGAYWYGSQLDIDTARRLCAYNNATSLQVAAPVVAGLAWALRHPQRGILEPDDLPHAELLALIRPWLGRMAGVFSDWTPLQQRGTLFPEPVDRDDPWQFVNVRVDG